MIVRNYVKVETIQPTTKNVDFDYFYACICKSPPNEKKCKLCNSVSIPVGSINLTQQEALKPNVILYKVIK